MFKNFLNKLKKNRRGYFSLLIFVALFCLTLFAEIIANDKPLMVGFEDKVYFPAFKSYSEANFGGVFETEADYRDKAVQELIRREGWMIFAPIPFSYDTINYQVKPFQFYKISPDGYAVIYKVKGITPVNELQNRWIFVNGDKALEVKSKNLKPGLYQNDVMFVPEEDIISKSPNLKAWVPKN